MRFEHILIGLAVFFAVISLGVSMYIGVGDTKGIMNEYEIVYDSNLFSNLTENDYASYKDNLDSLKEDNLEGEEDVSSESTESGIYKAALSQIGKVGSIVTTPFKLIGNIANKTKGIIPNYIRDLLRNVIIILSIAFVVYMFLRFKPLN